MSESIKFCVQVLARANRERLRVLLSEAEQGRLGDNERYAGSTQVRLLLLLAASSSKILCKCEAAFTKRLSCNVLASVRDQPSKAARLVHHTCISCCPTWHSLKECGGVHCRGESLGTHSRGTTVGAQNIRDNKQPSS